VMMPLFEVNRTVTLKRVLIAAGVTEKTNEAPPLFDDNDVKVSVAETAKSFATPVVAPLELDTEMVQIINNPTRAGAVLLQVKIEAVVGIP
jgi:hypothetical protein